MRFQRRGLPLWVLLLVCAVCTAGPLDEREFDIPRQRFGAALVEFRRQSGVDVDVRAGIPKNFLTQPVHGRLTPERALARMLEGSPVTAKITAYGNFTLHASAARAESSAKAPVINDDAMSSIAVPEVAIEGQRTLNTDQPRTENQAISYNIFNRFELDNSGETDARAFLSTELPAYSPRGVALGAAAITGASGQITVRGLPPSETVILFNGHRRAGSYAGGDLQQPDLSMIALPLVDQIEVRTASASALYGSDAVVGSINLVRKPGQSRGRLFLRAEDLSGISSGTQQFAGERVVSFREGRSWLAVDAAYLKQGGVELGERNFLTGGLERLARNNPKAYADAPLPPLGLLRNAHALGPARFAIGEGARFVFLPQGFRAGSALSALTDNADQYDVRLAPSAQAMGERSSVRPERRIHSVSAATRWEFSERFSADLDSGFAESLREGQMSALDTFGQVFVVPATHPDNPLQQNAVIAIGTDIADRRMTRRDRAAYATLGAEWHPSDASTVRLDHAWSTTRATIRQSVLTGNTPDLMPVLMPLLLNEAKGPQALTDAGLSLVESSSPEYRNTVDETTLRYSNSVAAFPRGVGSITVSAQQLLERLAVGPGGEFVPVDDVSDESDGRLAARRTKRTRSLLASANLPLVGSAEAARLLLELLVRRDFITIEAASDSPQSPTLKFSSMSYTTGLKWRALDALTLRIQYSTGFLPPPLPSLSGMSSTRITTQPLFDPLRGGESLSGALVRSGGNYRLDPERSHSYGAGFVWRGADENWRLSMDYTRLVKTNVVLTPSDLFFGDSDQYLREYTSRVHRANLEPNSPWTVGRVETIDTWSINIARQQVESVDLKFVATGNWLNGNLVFSTLGSYQPVSTHRAADFSQQENDAGVGNLASPVLRGVASLNWAGEHYSFGVTTRYTSSYEVARSQTIRTSQGARKVGSQNYLDVFAAYELPPAWLGVSAAQLRLDGRNVLGRDPPADLGERGYASRLGLEEFPGASLSLRVEF